MPHPDTDDPITPSNATSSCQPHNVDQHMKMHDRVSMPLLPSLAPRRLPNREKPTDKNILKPFSFCYSTYILYMLIMRPLKFAHQIHLLRYTLCRALTKNDVTRRQNRRVEKYTTNNSKRAANQGMQQKSSNGQTQRELEQRKDKFGVQNTETTCCPQEIKTATKRYNSTSPHIAQSPKYIFESPYPTLSFSCLAYYFDSNTTYPHKLFKIACYCNDALTELHTQEVAAKWHITQALQQHQEIKFSKPETHQSIGWRNQHKSRKRGHRNTASGYSQSRLCLRTSTSPLEDRLNSTGIQHQQNTTSNETKAGKEKIYISTSTYLHKTTSTQAAQLWQPRCSNTNKRDHQPQLNKPASKASSRSPHPGMRKRHTGEWKQNPRWSKGAPKSRPNQLQSSPTNLGKFSHSFLCKILSIHIRNLPFLSNEHTNKKYHNRVSYCEYVQLISQKRRRKAGLATQRS